MRIASLLTLTVAYGPLLTTVIQRLAKVSKILGNIQDIFSAGCMSKLRNFFGFIKEPLTSTMAATETTVIFAKLEAVKDIRSKTLQLEKMKQRILQEVELTEQEDKCLLEYKQEMELLMQEKMAHVEELRQIHADINAMESVIKQAEEARNRARETAKLIHNNDYQPLKHDIDRMRREFLGLERLPELYETESDLISPE
ncbi:zinc finger C4H2 domain-containing protein [Prorops nasuta]|uniref:zinc finger C4H2 domain-containing protein n=1 Tax=Prorops nasuta TaxID=863751 RepID=UPI0034CFC226